MCASPIESRADIDESELDACRRVLAMLAENPELCLAPDSPYTGILQQAQLLGRRVKSVRKKDGRRRDREFIEATGIRGKRKDKSDGRYTLADEVAAKNADNVSLSRARRCYICKRSYETLHSFYDLMCTECGDKNFAKRSQTANLAGRVVVLTGGRVKIGFQVALKLLRAGATVLTTSRFPCDAARRFSAEDDFDAWRDRLQIYGVDFRSLASVDQLCNDIRTQQSHIDILINNAAQTIRRPAAFYQHLLDGEKNVASLPAKASRLIATGLSKAGAPISSSSPGKLAAPDGAVENSSYGLHLSAALSQAPILSDDESYDANAFPPGQLDGDSQQVDRRSENSWIQEVGDVPLGELLEVHAVNSLTPFILIQQLEPMLLKSPAPDRYIVNVSAMEGQLNTRFKTGFHPHTNMAKAGMNMITRTSAKRFADRGIYMTSVDTGWITNEFPHQKTEQMKQDGFQPPLDEIDGAARVCDPIFAGVNDNEYIFGKFLKDYAETSW